MTLNLNKYWKIALTALGAIFVIAFISLAVAVGAKGKTVRAQRVEIANLQRQVDSLQGQCKSLGAMDAITVNATFNVNNKNIFSVNTTQANQVMKTYATLTRQEILDSILLKKQ